LNIATNNNLRRLITALRCNSAAPDHVGRWITVDQVAQPNSSETTAGNLKAGRELLDMAVLVRAMANDSLEQSDGEAFTFHLETRADVPKISGLRKDLEACFSKVFQLACHDLRVVKTVSVQIKRNATQVEVSVDVWVPDCVEYGSDLQVDETMLRNLKTQAGRIGRIAVLDSHSDRFSLRIQIPINPEAIASAPNLFEQKVTLAPRAANSNKRNNPFPRIQKTG